LKKLTLIWLLGCWLICSGATIYVDPNGSNTSPYDTWAKARTTLPNSGISAGDTVFISGGSSSQTYTLSSSWSPPGGTSGNPTTYQVGQDAGHSGTVIVDGNNTANQCIAVPNYVVIDGEYNGEKRLVLQNSVANPIYAYQRTNFTLKYFTADDDCYFHSAHYYEISHFEISSTYDAGMMMGGETEVTLLGVGANSIHDGVFYLSQADDASGNGCDGIQWAYSCDIYNNQFIGVQNGYAHGQHQDGVQTGSGQLRIFNNYFKDLGNYSIFLDCFGSIDDVQIYNNEFQHTASKWSGGYQQDVAVGRDGGASGTLYFTDIIVANNTCSNVAGSCIVMGSGAQAIWDSSDQAFNNVSANSNGFTFPSVITGYASPTNKTLTAGLTAVFVDYKTLGNGVSDLHLKATDTILIDQGVSMASYFTTDKDGFSRPQGAAWDIGAYEYAAGGSQLMSLGAGSQSVSLSAGSQTVAW
jgi:hypothetical protein